MAILTPLSQFILSFEGGFVNDPKDRGGATNRGVTIATWRAQGYDKDGDGDIDVDDLKLITAQDATNIMRRNYWDRYRASDLRDQSVANILVDWLWGSGKPAITLVQNMLCVKADGIAGPKTIGAINARNGEILFSRIKERREKFLYNIVNNNPSQKRFLNGWLRRLNSINYGYMIDNYGKTITW